MSTKRRFYRLRKKDLTRNAQWSYDFDYLNKLSLKDKKWLAKFIGEYYDGKIKVGDNAALHKSVKMRRDCYNRKNRSNRDLLSILDCRGKLSRLDKTNLDE